MSTDSPSQCREECGRCSRCVHALAWKARGGRPFLGVEQETALGAWPPVWHVNETEEVQP